MPDNNSQNIKNLAKDIKILILDVDGILTDGLVHIFGDGREMYEFNVYDGYGIKLWRRAGFKVGFLTGRVSDAVEFRAKQLEVDFLFRGASDKVSLIEKLAKEERVTMKNICYLGDDLQDLALLKKVGLSVSVPNAREEVKKYVHYVTSLKGGGGAVRELIEKLLKEKDLWDGIINQGNILS